MGNMLKFISYSLVALILCGLVYDVKKSQNYKTEMKNVLDIATKAAALQVDTDKDKIAQGLFEIDETRAKDIFNEYISSNLGADANRFISDMKAINTKNTIIYKSDSKKEYAIDEPTFVGSMKYDYKGIFIKFEIVVDTLAAAQLVNKNDLKN